MKKQPDTVLAKYAFLGLIVFLTVFIFSLMMWVLQLSGRCSKSGQQQEKKKKKGNTIIYLFLFILICSMAAQAVNQSYTVIVPKGAAKAAVKALKNA
jgi:hypothetical protein